MCRAQQSPSVAKKPAADRGLDARARPTCAGARVFNGNRRPWANFRPRDRLPRHDRRPPPRRPGLAPQAARRALRGGAPRRRRGRAPSRAGRAPRAGHRGGLPRRRHPRARRQDLGLRLLRRHRRRRPPRHRRPRPRHRSRIRRRRTHARRLPRAGGLARGLRDAARRRSLHHPARDQARRARRPRTRAPLGRRSAEVGRGLDGLDAPEEAPPDDRGHRRDADLHVRRVRHERLRQLRRRQLAAQELPHLAGWRRVPGRLGAGDRARSPRQRGPREGRGPGAADGSALPGRHAHAAPRVEPGGPADPRVVRAPDGARPRPRERDLPRWRLVHAAGDAGQAPVRLTARDHRRRRDERGRQRHLRLGRRGRPRGQAPSGALRRGRCAPTAGTGRPSSGW